MIQEMFTGVINWYMAHINYGTITLLMAIESLFIPFPSEAIIPPAAWKAAQGDLNIFLVVFFGTLGALIGALFNYYFAFYLGRAVVYRFAESRVGRMMLLSRKGVENAWKNIYPDRPPGACCPSADLAAGRTCPHEYLGFHGFYPPGISCLEHNSRSVGIFSLFPERTS